MCLCVHVASGRKCKAKPIQFGIGDAIEQWPSQLRPLGVKFHGGKCPSGCGRPESEHVEYRETFHSFVACPKSVVCQWIGHGDDPWLFAVPNETFHRLYEPVSDDVARKIRGDAAWIGVDVGGGPDRSVAATVRDGVVVTREMLQLRERMCAVEDGAGDPVGGAVVDSPEDQKSDSEQAKLAAARSRREEWRAKLEAERKRDPVNTSPSGEIEFHRGGPPGEGQEYYDELVDPKENQRVRIGYGSHLFLIQQCVRFIEAWMSGKSYSPLISTDRSSVEFETRFGGPWLIALRPAGNPGGGKMVVITPNDVGWFIAMLWRSLELRQGHCFMDGWYKPADGNVRYSDSVTHCGNGELAEMARGRELAIEENQRSKYEIELLRKELESAKAKIRELSDKLSRPNVSIGSPVKPLTPTRGDESLGSKIPLADPLEVA